MSNEESLRIILLERARNNKFCTDIEKALRKERERKIAIGSQIYRNAKINRRITMYIRFNTIEEYEDFCVYVYEKRLFCKNGGMVYA